MITSFRILICFALQIVIVEAAPVGICLHAYSPQAPAEKIECFEFDKVERVGADYRFFQRADRTVMVTAYRFRGTIPYKPDLAPTHPEFDKLLKLYEETARATSSTRVYLNPKILAMRSQASAEAKQAESVAALPTITLADGSKLVGCTVSKIEGGFVSVRHQDGVSKVSLKELDATEKKALNSTTDEWSLDEPSATPKDSTGAFAKIVFKNGRLLKKAKFKEVSKGELVFIAGGRSVSVPADQFPGELSILGEEVVTALQSTKNSPYHGVSEELPIALEGFVLIPAGAFTMGDDLDDLGDAPTHTVNLSAFYMAQNLVTKAEWDKVQMWAVDNGYTRLAAKSRLRAEESGGAGKAPNHPVMCVTWWEAVYFCNARSQMEGLAPVYTVDGAVMKTGFDRPTVIWTANGYRLPTEAEWEKAARGGLVGKRFPWGDTISHSQANYISFDKFPYDVSPTRGEHPSYSADFDHPGTDRIVTTNPHDGYPYHKYWNIITTSPVGSFPKTDTV